MTNLKEETKKTAEWMQSERFEGITRLYSARQVVAQRGTIANDYTVARDAAADFYRLLRDMCTNGKQITTFGPYSPGQAVAMKRAGIPGIYLGGWATSAKGSIHEDPGADLASYPLSQVPNEAASIVRALLTADKNQYYLRSRMDDKQRKATPKTDFSPFIIADADTGHGGEAHVRNLIRRFVEVGVPGYHIEDQKPGVKKCGHQGGKVLVAQNEQIQRLNAARFQLDVMGVPGIIVARTDAESATLLEGSGDERDQPFVLGATYRDLPTYKTAVLAVIKNLYQLGIKELNGHLLFQVSAEEYASAQSWLEKTGLLQDLKETAEAFKKNPEMSADAALGVATGNLVDAWQTQAGLKTYGEAVADAMSFRINEGVKFDLSLEQWNTFASTASYQDARKKVSSMGLQVAWDPELPKTPEGYYRVRGGIDYAIAKSLAAAPFADILWMETKTANLKEAKIFADAIHERFPGKMLAYNLSPSFNWDTTGMTEEEMRQFPKELGKLGYVFDFITYGGHQIDGLAAEEFATALNEDGMLALARLQRKFRLLESPYQTPQTLVGGPRLDAALMAASGRTATTKAMGKGSTQFQHLVQTEVPPKELEQWLDNWSQHYNLGQDLRVQLRPHKAGSELLELSILAEGNNKVANIIFASIQDRRGSNILSVRDQNTFDQDLRQKRLMTLAHLFLVHRYKVEVVHYVSPTDDNQLQTESMKGLGIYTDVNIEVGQIIVASVNQPRVQELLDADSGELNKLIAKK